MDVCLQVLCVIDKEGVVAHPLPSAEKVFLATSQTENIYVRRDSVVSESQDDLCGTESIDSAGHGHKEEEEDEYVCMCSCCPRGGAGQSMLCICRTVSQINGEEPGRAGVALDINFDPESAYGMRYAHAFSLGL